MILFSLTFSFISPKQFCFDIFHINKEVCNLGKMQTKNLDLSVKRHYRVNIIYRLWCIWCKASTVGSPSIYYHLFPITQGSRLIAKFNRVVLWERCGFSFYDCQMVMGTLLQDEVWRVYPNSCMTPKCKCLGSLNGWHIYHHWLLPTSSRWILSETGASTKEKSVLSAKIISNHILTCVS